MDALISELREAIERFDATPDDYRGHLNKDVRRSAVIDCARDVVAGYAQLNGVDNTAV